MVKPESIPCTTTFSPAPPPPQPTYNAFGAPTPPPLPPHHYEISQRHPPALLPPTQHLPPLPITTSDPMRTTTWGPITYTRKPSRKEHESDKDKKPKKNANNEKRREEVTLSGRERSWTYETVEVLAEGLVRKTWVTDITITTEEVVKQFEGTNEEKKKKKKTKNEKSKGSKEDSSSDDSTDSDESDSDEEDPIQRLANLTKFHGPVMGRKPPVQSVMQDEWIRLP